MADEVILTFADHLGSELVDIIAKGKTYTVHKDPMLAKCESLKKIVVPGAPGKQPYIDFKDEDMGVVSMLVDFVYRGSIPTSEEYISEIKAKTNTTAPTNASIFQPSRPIFGQSMSESRLSPFGKPPYQPGVMVSSSSFAFGSSTFGVPQTPRNPSIFMASTPTAAREPKSPQHQALTELYQVTLLRLCILAEKLTLPTIFNAAIRSYSRGESIAGRATPIEHARLIYGHSAANSTLRDMILDGMYNLGEDGLEKCMAFASEDKNFFRALCTRSLRPKQEFHSVVEDLNNGAYDLVDKGLISLGATFQPLKTRGIFDAPSGKENRVDAKMEE